MKQREHSQKVIVTQGNLGFVANGTKLFTITVDGLKVTKRFNVAKGQPVMWKTPQVGATPVAITPAQLLTAADISNLHIGVGYDMDNDGLVDAIRQIGFDEIEGCLIQEVTANAPKCGRAQIEAIYPGCITNEPIAVRVRVEDNTTRSFGLRNKAFEEFVVSYSPETETGCENCPETLTCDEFMCGLVDKLNNDLDIKINGSLYPDWLGLDAVKRPYRAVKLHENWTSYCIAPENSTCENCNVVDAITTFTIDGGAPITLQSSTNPANNAQTLVAQLKDIGAQIEAAVRAAHGKHGGFVVVTQGTGNCCPVQIHISSCVPVAITGLTPCEDAIIQFPTFTEQKGICQDCSSSSTTWTPNCGIAVIADQDQLVCDEFLTQDNAYYGRTIQIEIISSEGNPGTFVRKARKATLLEGQIPSLFGTEVQWKEYRQLAGGEGRTYSNTNNYQGRLSLPDTTAKIRKAITAKCKESYCEYYLGTHHTQNGWNIGNFPASFSAKNFIYVPQGDTTTKTAVEALFTKLSELSPNGCRVIGSAVCEDTCGDPLN